MDERNSRVSALLQRELAAALSKTLPKRSVRVRRAEGMGGREPAIRSSVLTRSPLAVGAMTAMLSADDALWAMAIDRTAPATYRELVNLSYVVEQLRSGITRHGQQPQLDVAIDNPSERRACAKARTIAREISRDSASALRISLLGLHPLERVFTTEATGPTDLYYNDPGQVFVDPDARRYGLAELLATVYPGGPRPPRRTSARCPDLSRPLSNPPGTCSPAALAATPTE